MRYFIIIFCSYNLADNKLFSRIHVSGAIKIWRNNKLDRWENMTVKGQHPGWGNLARNIRKIAEDNVGDQGTVGYAW